MLPECSVIKLMLREATICRNKTWGRVMEKTMCHSNIFEIINIANKIRFLQLHMLLKVHKRNIPFIQRDIK